MFGLFVEGKLTGIFDGDKSLFEDKGTVVDLPEDFDGFTGIYRDDLDESLHLKTDAERVAAGTLTLDERHKLLGGRIVEKTEIELMEEGVIQLPEGFKILEGKLFGMNQYERFKEGVDAIPKGYKLGPGEQEPLVAMNDDEMLSAGLIDEAEKKRRGLQKELATVDLSLNSIDQMAIRPLRAKLAGTSNEEDDRKLVELEAQAVVHRDRRSQIIAALATFEEAK